MEYYGTLGPACSTEERLEELFRAGMTGVRLNLSHVTLEESAPLLEKFHAAAKRCGVEPKLLVDLQGPELRVGALPAQIELREEETVVLGRDGIPVPAMVMPWLRPKQPVLMDDGKLLLEIMDADGEKATARVLRGGTLRGRKSLALPGVRGLRPPTLTEQDRINLSHAAQYGVTGVMQPFVRGREDLETVRHALEENGCGYVRLFAKLEDMNGVEQLDELLPACDELVIARGDLGNAMPLWELPAVQKRVAEKCRAAGKPFMVVTQLLASMEHAPVPTRAEVSDIFNAVLDGASSVMVTGETAVGEYPAEVMRYLVRTAGCALAFQRKHEYEKPDGC